MSRRACPTVVRHETGIRTFTLIHIPLPFTVTSYRIFLPSTTASPIYYIKRSTTVNVHKTDRGRSVMVRSEVRVSVSFQIVALTAGGGVS